MGRAVSDLVAAVGDLVAGPSAGRPDARPAPPDPGVAHPVRLQRIDVTD
jgi:hypothetical protein